ncbi:TetR/AcrR family transcriptional regulator [Virgibacillus ndiopensis]|uniref:TetR/AcrR family transcriptional regulator n=1 Tax=Virgibacillus ndiopensis TaxID=2004408 RepID=UPI00159BCE19|nr:TetR/AcrR family transcriptional regulator [Virgibacillus ndiopensis]
MDGYERRALLKKTSIEKAAFQLLNSGGIKAFRIKDIAEIAGTSPASIYNYYGSKEKLLVEVMKGFYEQQYQKFTNLVHNDDSFIEQLSSYFLQKPEGTNLLRKDIMEEILKEHSELNELIKEYQNKMSPLFVEWIEKGRKQGYVKEGISNETIMYYYNMMSKAMDNLFNQLSEHQDVEEIFKEVKQLFFYGFINDVK